MINRRFSNIVLHEFAISDGKGHLEDVPDAPNIPQVGGGESGVKALLVCTDSGVV
ncbi:hypothetical protein P692DRAFT_20837807, partial [Suillus brevipes Sb2]